MIRRGAGPLHSRFRQLEAKAGVRAGEYKTQRDAKTDAVTRMAFAALPDAALIALHDFWKDWRKQPENAGRAMPDPPGALGETLTRCLEESSAAYDRGVRPTPDLLGLESKTDAEIDDLLNEAESRQS